MAPWTVSPGSLCNECLLLPPDIFVPGSTTEHYLYGGPNALQRIQAAVRNQCRLCTTILDALKANSRSSDIVIDTKGILLRTEWTRQGYEEHKTRQYKYSAENSNRLLIEGLTNPTVEHLKPKPGPLLLLRSGSTLVSFLRFNLQETPPMLPPKRRVDSSTFKTHWDPNRRACVFDTRETPLGTTPLSNKADSPHTFELLNNWLDECQTNHRFTCALVGERVLSTGFSLPTRLLYCEEDTIILVDTNSIPRGPGGFGPPYTALSYRWGDPTLMPVTTKANIEAARSGIKLKDLPQTFQHLIEVTRKIKVSYTWIDALCIIQDDDEDKEREIGAMDLVYSMAICLITASASASCWDGFFPPRGHNPDRHVRAFTLSSSLATGPISVTIQPYLADWGQTLRRGPLTYRGWCFQERQLAKRIIHFTESHILWECRSSIASEDRPKLTSELRRDTATTERPFRFAWVRVHDMTGLHGHPERTGPWYRDWLQIVEEYSTTQLTYSTDRLPALAGLAAFFQLKLGVPRADYIAGLWKQDFPSGLCWMPSFEARRAQSHHEAWPPSLRTATGFKAIGADTTLIEWLPSWSWISYPGAVRYGYMNRSNDETMLSLAGVTLDPRAKNGGLPPYYFPPELTGFTVTFPTAKSLRLGRISNGYICLTSYIAVISVSEKNLIKQPTSPRTHSHPKCYYMYPTPMLSLKFLSSRRRSPFAGGAIYFDQDPINLNEVQIHCLRLGTGRSLFSGTDGAFDYGLALMEIKNRFPLDQTAMGYFPRMRRVGMFEIDIWNNRWTRDAAKTSVIIV